MIDRKAVGRMTSPVVHDVERGALRRFAESVGDANPIHSDVEAAKAAGYPNVVAPPSFPLSFTSGLDLKAALGIPFRQLLLADWTAEYERPIVAGDRLLVTGKIIEAGERPSNAGRIEVAVLEEEARDERGQLVVRVRKTYVVRNTREV